MPFSKITNPNLTTSINHVGSIDNETDNIITHTHTHTHTHIYIYIYIYIYKKRLRNKNIY